MTQLQLQGGRAVSTRVYVTNALVHFAGGDFVFLGRTAKGWKVDSAGCRFVNGKPRDRPADCQVQS